MTGTSADPLRDLVRARTRALEAEAVQNGGRVPAEAVAELDRLRKLLEIRDTAAPAPRRPRWPVAAVFAATLVVVSVLLFAHVRSTHIELDVVASAVSFQVPRDEILLEAMPVAALGAAGIGRLQLPSRTGAPGSEDHDGAALRLEPAAGNASPGSVTLPSLLIPAGTVVRIEAIDAATYRISLDGRPVTLDVGVRGTVRLGRPGMPAEDHVFERPRTVRLESGDGPLDVDVTLADGDAARLQPVPITSLTLVRVDELIGPDATVVRERSTVLAGSLVFTQLDDATRPLREGQMLRFDPADGEIRWLLLDDGRITVRFGGTVRALMTGADASRRSLMPTWLEWLHARHGMSLLWGTTLYLFGVVLVVLRWWGTRL